MNEVTKIHLGRQAFTISVDAYKLLQEYLQEIKKQVGKDHKDVVDEVELRMVELLAERTVTGDKVILKEDVDYLKEQLGEPGDFKDDEDAHERKEKAEASETSTTKRFFRDTEHGMVAGVAAGLAAYVGIDVLIIRLLFIFFTFASGLGVLLYVLLWILGPEAKTGSDRLQMAGKPVTIDSIKQAVQEVDVPAAAHRVARHTQMAVAIGIGILLSAVGLALILGGAGIFAGAITAGSYVLFHGVQVVRTTVFPFGAKEVGLVASLLVMAVLLALGLVLAGITLLRRKWTLSGWLVGGLAALFVLTAAVAGALGLDAVPRLHDRVEALHQTQSIALASFSSVKLNGRSTQFIYQPDTSYRIKMQYWGTTPLKPQVKDGVLTVDTTPVATPDCSTVLCFYGERQVQIIIMAPSLASVQIDGDVVSFTNIGVLASDLSIDADMNVNLGLGNTDAERMTVISSRSSARRQVQLHGLSGKTNNGFITADPISMTIGQAHILDFKTDACHLGDYLVVLQVPPAQLLVNGVGVNAPDELGNLHNSIPNAYNCVTTTFSDPVNFTRR